VAAIVPVPQPVVGNPGGNGLVVAFPQADEDFRVQGGATAATGRLHGAVRVAQQSRCCPSPADARAQPAVVQSAAGDKHRNRARRSRRLKAQAAAAPTSSPNHLVNGHVSGGDSRSCHRH
jgi:hypothetical protein